MNTSPTNTLPIAVRKCSVLKIIQMFFGFIDRRHLENTRTASFIESAEDYSHLHASVDIANRYLSVATSLVKQMKGDIS